MVSEEERIKEYIEFDKCNKCGCKQFIAYFEKDDGYIIDLTQDEPKITITPCEEDPQAYIIIKCDKCGNVMVDDVFEDGNLEEDHTPFNSSMISNPEGKRVLGYLKKKMNIR